MQGPWGPRRPRWPNSAGASRKALTLNGAPPWTFTIPPRVEDFRARIARFVADDMICRSRATAANWDAHDNIAHGRAGGAARQGAGRRAVVPATETRNRRAGSGQGGHGGCYEEMNRSIFGPVVFNSAAPDDGNMMVLEQAGTAAQRARWLAPIVRGDVRSAFAMTEPHPGGGSDPGMMLTTATRKGDRYVIHGRKWFITGAAEARPFHPDRPHLGRPAPGPRPSCSPRPARLADRPAHPDHGAGRTRRALRTGVRRAGDSGRKHPAGRRRRAEADADAPWPGAADPLHALAGPVETLRGNRPRPMPEPHRLWQRLSTAKASR
jgi:hypothetical protein